jgi:cholesterol transport system auxiliary component
MFGVRIFTVLLAAAPAAGCGVLQQKSAAPPSYYSLDGFRAGIATDANPSRRLPAPLATNAPTLVVSPTRAAAGFDSNRIIYTRDAHKVEYFAHSEWIDTPARMLAPLIVTAIEDGGAFRAVVPTPSAAIADLKLDTEILRLQQEFSGHPSRVRFTLRAYLVDSQTRRVLAWREFDESVDAAGDDPYNGVVAANRAVRNVMTALQSLCAEAAAGWTPGPASAATR